MKAIEIPGEIFKRLTLGETVTKITEGNGIIREVAKVGGSKSVWFALRTSSDEPADYDLSCLFLFKDEESALDENSDKEILTIVTYTASPSELGQADSDGLMTCYEFTTKHSICSIDPRHEITPVIIKMLEMLRALATTPPENCDYL
ncbi:MAG: hypothetical protein WCO09_03760 [bacterium]